MGSRLFLQGRGGRHSLWLVEAHLLGQHVENVKAVGAVDCASVWYGMARSGAPTRLFVLRAVLHHAAADKGDWLGVVCVLAAAAAAAPAPAPPVVLIVCVMQRRGRMEGGTGVQEESGRSRQRAGRTTHRVKLGGRQRAGRSRSAVSPVRPLPVPSSPHPNRQQTRHTAGHPWSASASASCRCGAQQGAAKQEGTAACSTGARVSTERRTVVCQNKVPDDHLHNSGAAASRSAAHDRRRQSRPGAAATATCPSRPHRWKNSPPMNSPPSKSASMSSFSRCCSSSSCRCVMAPPAGVWAAAKSAVAAAANGGGALVLPQVRAWCRPARAPAISGAPTQRDGALRLRRFSSKPSSSPARGGGVARAWR